MKYNYLKIAILPVLLLTVNGLMAQTKELSLQETITLASKGNRKLQVQMLESSSAFEKIREARSFLLPSINANGAYNIYSERPVIYLRNDNGPNKLNDVKYGGRYVFDGSLTADYPLINPALRSYTRSAGLAYEMEGMEVKQMEEQLVHDVAWYYLTILMNNEQRKLLGQSLDRNRMALKDSRALYLQGKHLKTDTLSNFISVQNLQAAISSLENNSYVLSIQLKQLLGLDEKFSFRLIDNLLTPGMEHVFGLTGEVLSSANDNRTDIKMQQLKIERERESLVAEKAAFKPQLWAVAQYQLQTQSDNFNIGSYGFPRTSFAGVRLRIPLYSGNRRQIKSLQSELAIKKNLVELQDLKNSVTTELVSLNANLQQAYDQMKIQQQNVEAANVNYSMMHNRYSNGLGSRLELTDTELELTKSKLNLLREIYNARLIELQLKKATGKLGFESGLWK